MKILFLHRWVGVHGGGTETHLLELAKRFSNLGHQITILTREGNRLHDLDKKIRVLRISANFKESDHSYEDIRVYIHTALFMLKTLSKLILLRIKGDKFDIISVHFTTEAIIARIYRFLFKTPFISVLEGYTPLEAKTAKYANAMIAISNFEASIYKRNHNLESKVIYIGVDKNKFDITKQNALALRKSLAANDEIMILTVCRLEPRKDLLTLLKAATLVASKNKKIKFVIAGDGISRQIIEKSIIDNNLGSTVTLAGFVEDKGLPYYYAAADIFLLTSKEEWFGIVFLEAMASGLPIIATNVDACPEVVGECGLFFDKEDFTELSKIILKLAENQVLREDLTLKSKQRSIQFDWNKQILLYEAAYKNTIEKTNV